MLTQIRPPLQVQDLARSIAFYGKQLGFQTGAIDNGFAAIGRDGCLIYLAQKTAGVARSVWHCRAARQWELRADSPAPRSRKPSFGNT